MFNSPYKSRSNDKNFEYIYECCVSLQSTLADWQQPRSKQAFPKHQEFLSQIKSEIFIMSRINAIVDRFLLRGDTSADEYLTSIRELEFEIIKFVYQIFVHIRYNPRIVIRNQLPIAEEILSYANKITYPYISSIEHAMLINLLRLN